MLVSRLKTNLYTRALASRMAPVTIDLGQPTTTRPIDGRPFNIPRDSGAQTLTPVNLVTKEEVNYKAITSVKMVTIYLLKKFRS